MPAVHVEVDEPALVLSQLPEVALDLGEARTVAAVEPQDLGHFEHHRRVSEQLREGLAHRGLEHLSPDHA